MSHPSTDLFQNNNIPVIANTVGDEVGTGTLKGGFTSVFIWGTFGGGTVTIQVSPEVGVWFETGISATTNGLYNLDVASRANNIKIRAQLTGATSPSLRAEAR